MLLKNLLINSLIITILFFPAISRASDRPVVYLVPHQDDEMFMAGNIKRNLNAGRNVYVILATDGSASRVRDILNGKNKAGHVVYCHWHDKYHNPKEEKYKPLNKQRFNSARNDEFFTAMTRLGVNPSNIIFANPGGKTGQTTTTNPYRDRHLSKELAGEIIAKYYNILGDGSYNTTAANLNHADHAALRDALKDFAGIAEKHFFSEKQKVGREIKLSAKARLAKYYAMKAYYRWNPAKGQFAIGAHSMKELLNSWDSDGAEYEIEVADLPKK